MVIDVMSSGVVGDGVTDDSAAIQSCINTASGLVAAYGFPGATVYAPEGYLFKLSQGISIPNTINVKFESPLLFSPSIGDAVTIGTSPNWMQYGDYFFKAILKENPTAPFPSGVNTNGATGLRVNHLQFSKVRVDVIQGFDKYGIHLDGHGDLFSHQVIQHNTFELGQIVNNGIGMFSLSLDAATSSVQANKFNIQNIYQNWTNIQLDDANNSDTCSNTFNINAMDNNSSINLGGHGILHYGQYNHFEIGYMATDLYAGSLSHKNTFRVYNTYSTGVVIYQKPNDTNYYWVV